MAEPLSDKRVIVAEDSFLTARLLVASLTLAGRMAVVIARDGDEVMELVDRHRPHLLLLDMNLSRPSGAELLRNLNAPSRGLRVIALTQPSQADVRAIAASLGVVNFVDIPFDPAELADLVGRLLAS